MSGEKSETVLVTGGTGFLAGWCIILLLQEGYFVRTTVRHLAKKDKVKEGLLPLVNVGDKLSFVEADLTSDAGWDEAARGCDYVLHVASSMTADKDPNKIIALESEGDLRVLKAAAKAGVKRVVLTSSMTAAFPSNPIRRGTVLDESIWSDPEDPKLNIYRKSKILAELAAWDFMKTYEGSMSLTSILPGAIFGPILSLENLRSVDVIQELMQGKMPLNHGIGLQFVDVRDVAKMHLLAMRLEKAAGERFIAIGDFMWMADVAKILRSGFGDRAKRIPKDNFFDFISRFFASFNKKVHTAEKAKRLLNWQPKTAKETIVDCAKSLYDFKVI